MAYCDVSDLSRWVLQAYLDKVEELNPGLLQGAIDGVSAEIDDVLRKYYTLPLSTVPETVKRICAVLACYRCLGAITSLMDTEAQANNEYVYIQGQAKQAQKDLDAIRDGKVDLELEKIGVTSSSPDEIEVIAGSKLFGPDTWGKF